jgi:hypothetical protein
MSDLVLRAVGRAVCVATVGFFALVLGLASLGTANAKSAHAAQPSCHVAAAG